MEWGVVGAILVLALSASLLFIGVLWSALIALGHKRYIWGLGSLICFPVALFYCATHREEAAQAAKFLYPGALLTTLCIIPIYWLSSQLIPV